MRGSTYFDVRNYTLMVYSQLSKYLDEIDPVPTKGSGLSTAKLKQLKELNFVELTKIPLKSGKLPANPNGFVLTSFGRMVVRKSLKKEVNTSDLLLKTKKMIGEVKQDYDSLKNSINTAIIRLEEIEQQLNGISLTQEPITEMKTLDNTQIHRILLEAERMVPQNLRLGPLNSVDVYYTHLRDKLDISNKQINDILYQQFQGGKLDLQTGPQKGKTYVLSPSGSKFQWGKLKG